MKHLLRSSLFAAILLTAIVACKHQPKEQTIYVVSTNDLHAAIDNFPKAIAVIDSLRTAHPDMLLLGAGDNRSGNPINDRYSKVAYPMVALMNEAGFEASAFGNHEWDGGPKALSDVVSWSNFPYLCCNVSFDDSLNIPYLPYKIFERNGLKIGVIGAIGIGENGLPDFHPKHAGGSHFTKIDDVLPQYQFLRDSCNMVALLSHCGHEEERELAEKFPWLDAIFGGHSHTRVSETTIVNGVLVTQAEYKLKYLTLSTFNLVDGKIVDKKQELIPVANSKLTNEKVQAMVDEFNSNDVFEEVLAENEADLVDIEPMGCFMADAIREVAGTDLAFQNYGGVRYYDTLRKGPFTLKTLYALDPFDNEIIRMDLSGKEIIDMLTVAYPTDNRVGPVLCSGCTYEYKIKDGEMTDIKVKLDNGKPLEMDKKYSVVMNSYMASVFDFEREDDGRSVFMTSNEMSIEYLKNHPKLNYAKVKRTFEKK